MVKLVLVRHGESIANAANVYTGWNDVPLTEKGKAQAQKAGELIKQIPDFYPTHIHTSVLSRAIVTANIVADVCHFLYLPMTKTWRLNERHYGALRGLNKDISRKVFGAEQVLEWRRGFDSVPPKQGSPIVDRRYQLCDQHLMPRAESLHQTQLRLLPYYHDEIASRLMMQEDQLVVAHGSSLRALIKKLEEINDHDIVKLEVPNAEPIIYTMDEQLNIIDKKILH
ncbi:MULTISPECIES: 2,3-diphosphoglycerate-dependent phosphoglycerate mutase [Lactobacillus]|uniref:2,3-bisphosphoglycerate-dependent phosphoglycerate mutase n=1 Tax=Lactobacillus xujianguonis TaxID=2495899 RepID=A0A437SV95_9LACO|nr:MULTISPECIES: 2,3-diphosphoglycerate-dependent phosphoglycerate mutase [Lactobacillus]RVU70834.1 2,3-diphosphoglycerate-dependent phosphoglycerate mutase [Lactobacillus xujianguonis]RVU77065.1 2,3-diphosphoglycerate-dependent phosphoglycerate mutase [Lactobacillus xujianguonis]